MKLFSIAVRQGTGVPMVALMVASGASMALMVGRILWTGNLRYSFLAWNLFLAWVPLVLALVAIEEPLGTPKSRWRFAGLSLAWLLFFPNAPYIWTDISHLNGSFKATFWVDLVLILSCAFTGLVLGFVSLYLMQSAVKRLTGPLAGWAFVLAVTLLSGFGIYIGRFLRFNTWDILYRPLKLANGIGKWMSDPTANANTWAFPLFFAVFLFVSYLLLYALTHVRPPQAAGAGLSTSDPRACTRA